MIGLLILHAVMLSYSRGAMLAGCVGLAWLLWRHRPRWQVGLAIPLLAIAIAVMAGQEIRDEFRSITQYEQDQSAQSRLDSWQAAWQMAWDNPLTGVGIRNSNLYSHNYGADRVGRTTHNQYLQLAADAGVPALGVYLAMVGMSFLGASRARRMLRRTIDEIEADEDMSDKGRQIQRLQLYEHLSIALESAILTFAAGAMFLSLETFEVSLLVMVLAGALPGITRRVTADDPQASTAQREPDPNEPDAQPVLAS